ncbi:MAG: AAA family ATPase, partial [Acidimicrobiia bacterium]|nr:AAA family ATPase [Acidimicrobiia bacterium]
MEVHPLILAAEQEPIPDRSVIMGGVARPRSSELVGRTEEVTALGATIDRAGAGEGSVALIGGEAGIGKTRLLTEVEARGVEAGALVLAGGCVDLGEGGVPFSPFIEAVRALRRSPDAPALDAALA